MQEENAVRNDFKTAQEGFWAGNFGSEYIRRNDSAALVATNTSLFGKILPSTHDIRTVLELGANIGMNLRALKVLLPSANLSAVEINKDAADLLRSSGVADKVFEQSLLAFEPEQTYDLVFTKGVLIHIAPEALHLAYEALYSASGRYVLTVEYYNPSPVSIPYRGHAERLFKRDFAGELLYKYPDLQLRDYGFVYHRDPNFPADDLTWFLLEKSAK